MKVILYGLIAICISSLISCDPDYIFDQQIEIPNAEWEYNDSLDYSVEINDSTKIYNLYLDIEHTKDYARQNLYIIIHTKFPGGERISEQVPIDIADKSGKWYGDCNRNYCMLRVNIQKGAFFNSPGNYVFTIEQFMRINPLKGIINVALRIEDTGILRK